MSVRVRPDTSAQFNYEAPVMVLKKSSDQGWPCMGENVSRTGSRLNGVRGRADLLASVSVLVATLLVVPNIASASPVTFDLAGIFASGSTLGGTLTIDTATGVATAVAVTVGPPGSLAFGVIEGQSQVGPATVIAIGNGGGLPDLNLVFPAASPIGLIGYAGGPLCVTPSSCGGQISNIIYSLTPPISDPLAQGNATVAPVPEPATLALLAGALVGSGFWRRREHWMRPGTGR